MKSTLGLAGIIAAGEAPASVVKSLLAARSSGYAEGSKDWRNPYVTDGLVAMWDGEWNAGGWVHDANATSWVDLIGGVSLTINRGVWTDDGLAWEPNNPSQATNTAIPSSLKDVITSNNITVEFVIMPKALGCNGYSLCNRVFSVYSVGANNVFSWFKIKSSPFDVSSRGTVDSPCSFVSVVSPPKNIKWLFNNTSISSTSNYSDPKPNDTIEISNRGVTHCLRIYSRALTAAEIAANYAIDKERFNLP